MYDEEAEALLLPFELRPGIRISKPNQGRGRELAAASRFSSGDTILFESPLSSSYAAALSGPSGVAVCSLCFMPSVNRPGQAAAGSDTSLQACSSCKIAKYCSKTCQIAHWTTHGHSVVCKATKAYLERERAGSWIPSPVDGGGDGLDSGLEPDLAGRARVIVARKNLEKLPRTIANFPVVRTVIEAMDGAKPAPGVAQPPSEAAPQLAQLIDGVVHASPLAYTVLSMPQLESASSRYSTLAAAIVLLRLLHPQLSPAQGEADWDTPTTLRYIFENPVTTAAVPGQATPAQIAPRWAQVVRQIVRVLLFTSVNGVTVYNANLGVPLGGAVYPLFSMANHSCSPNAAVTFAFRRGKPPLVSLRAMTAIAPGEAITISYAPTSSSLTSQPLPTPLRRRTQLASHYFVCCCPMCEPPVPMAAAHVPRDTGGDVRCIPIYSTVSDCSVAGLSCAYIDALSAAILSCRAKSSGSGPNPAGNALQPRCDGLLVPVVFRLPQRGVGGVALLAALECTGCGRCVPVSLSGAAQPATAATGDAPDETVPQIEVPGSLAARLGLIPGKSGVRTVAGSVLVRLLSHFWRLTQSTAQLLSDRPIAARSTVFEPVDVGESVATFAASVSGLIQQLKALSESQAPKSQLLPLMQRLRAEGGRLVGCVSSLATALAAFEGRITPAQAMAAAGISPAGEAWEGEEKADSTLSFPIGVSQREYEAARTEFLADPSNNGSRAGPASASGRGSAAGADDDTPPPFEALESQFEANKVHAARVRRVRFVTRSGGDATAAPEAAASSVESCQLAVTAVLPLPIAVTPGPRQGDPSGTVGADRLRLRGQLGALKDMFTPRQKLEELTAADATWMARGGLPSSHAEAAPLLLSILASGGRAMSQQQRADLAELVQLALGYARAGPASEPLLDDVSLAALFAEALTIGAQLQTQSERTPEPDPPQRPQSSQAEAKTDSPGIPAGFELIFADSNPVEMTHTLEALRYASGVGAPPDASAMAANPRSRARVAAALGDPDRVNSGNVALLAALFPSVAQIDRLLDRNRDKHALSAASDFNETAAVLKAFEPMAQRLSRPDKQLTREPRCVDGEVLSDAAGRLLKVEEFGSGGAGDTPSRFVAAPLISPLHRWRLELLCSLSALTELALDWPDPGAPVAPLQPLCLAATEAALATLGQSPGHPLNPLGAPAIRLALPEPPAEASEGKQTALPDLVGKTFFALSGRASAALSALRQSPASRVQRRAWLLDPRFDAAGAVARGRVRGESPTPLTWTLGFNEISALTPIVLRINGTEAAYASVQALKCMAKLSVWLSETVRFPRHIGRSLRPAVGGSAATGTRNLAGTAVDNVWPSDSDHLGTNKDRVSFQQLLEETTAAMSLASSGSSVVRRS